MQLIQITDRRNLNPVDSTEPSRLHHPAIPEMTSFMLFRERLQSYGALGLRTLAQASAAMQPSTSAARIFSGGQILPTT